MAKKNKSAARRSRKKVQRKAAKKKTSTNVKRKRPLSEAEMLARLPEGKEWLTTPEVQHVFNDAHWATIYRWIKEKRLNKKKMRSNGNVNLYKRSDVVKLIGYRSTPRPRPGHASFRTSP